MGQAVVARVDSTSGSAVVLRIDCIDKRFARRGQPVVEALGPVSLDLRRGELVSIVGPSGCGKSTLLSIIAGLMPATSGTLLLDGRPLSGPGSDRGLVFQSYTLFPWLSVRDNVAFGLKLAGKSRVEQRQVAEHFIVEMGLSGFAGASSPRAFGGHAAARGHCACPGHLAGRAARPGLRHVSASGSVSSGIRTDRGSLERDALRQPPPSHG